MLTLDKNKNILEFDYQNIKNFQQTKKISSIEIKFVYNEKPVVLTILISKTGNSFLNKLMTKLNVHLIEEVEDSREIIRIIKPIKFKIDIINGKEQLKKQGYKYTLIQSEQGSVEISVDFKEAETFKIIKWERVENIQKSAFDIAGWSVIGSAFGNAGTIAGAMGANIGKDKSVATLFLKRENGEKVPLVIKCDQKDLEKLSLLIVADEEEISLNTNKPSTESFGVPTEELIKLKELLDLGILTQEEFEAKKKQILNL